MTVELDWENLGLNTESCLIAIFHILKMGNGMMENLQAMRLCTFRKARQRFIMDNKDLKDSKPTVQNLEK